MKPNMGVMVVTRIESERGIENENRAEVAEEDVVMKSQDAIEIEKEKETETGRGNGNENGNDLGTVKESGTEIKTDIAIVIVLARRERTIVVDQGMREATKSEALRSPMSQ
jgi:hypothetical protein